MGASVIIIYVNLMFNFLFFFFLLPSLLFKLVRELIRHLHVCMWLAAFHAVQSKQFSFSPLSQWKTRFPLYRLIHPWVIRQTIHIYFTVLVSGQNKSAPGGVWVALMKLTSTEKGLRSLRKELRDKYNSSRPLAIQPRKTFEPTHVAVKTWNWIGEFCPICLLVLTLI